MQCVILCRRSWESLRNWHYGIFNLTFQIFAHFQSHHRWKIEIGNVSCLEMLRLVLAILPVCNKLAEALRYMLFNYNPRWLYKYHWQYLLTQLNFCQMDSHMHISADAYNPKLPLQLKKGRGIPWMKYKKQIVTGCSCIFEEMYAIKVHPFWIWDLEKS